MSRTMSGPVAVPEYGGLIRGAKLLETMAGLCGTVGYACLLVAGLLCCFAISRMNGGLTVQSAELFTAAVPLAAYGIVCIVAAVFLRFVGAIGLAVRDIARNSFK